MDFTGKKFLNKLIAIVAILAMTLSDFVLVGANLVSYAVDVASTTSKNVEFSTYFVGQNGEKVSKVERTTDNSDLRMYVEISVKNEGYLDGGEISLENSNFKIKNNVLSEVVSKIEANKVYLNRINAGKVERIELEIEKNLPDTMPESLLKAETNVVLQGKYFDSKSIQTQKPQTISGTAKVEIDWKSGESVKAETSLSLLTNKIFEIQGEQKRIVQVLITSKVTNNNYPVKNTKINIISSQGAENATVMARSTAATNVDATLNQNYSSNEGKLSIEISNNEVNGNIKYNKNVIDSFVATYIYPVDFEYQGIKIVSNTEITTFDNLVKPSENRLTLQDEFDGIITYEVDSSEKEMYKGKIYTGESRNYESTTRINVNKAGIAEKIEINELNAGYKAETHTGASIFFTKTTISKSEFEKIFGTEGYIKFTDNNGTVIANVNSTTQVDESGNIVVNYPENVKEVKIETRKPVAEGTLNLVNTKTIKEDRYDREQVKAFQEITEVVRGKYEDENETTVQNHIALKDTSSKARVTMTNTSLSTTEKTNTRMLITLETDDESKDLYKNPTIKITFPRQVVGYEYNAELLNANGLKIQNKGKSKEGDNLVITFELTGEQKQYVTDITKGTSLVLDLIMEQDKLATTSKEEIKVNYTNENAISYVDNGEQKVQVNVIAKNPIITTNKINELVDVQTSTEERKDVELEVDSEEKTFSQVMDIVNNETSKITDVKILGKYPVNTSKNNMGITIKTPAVAITQKEGVKIFYSTEENPTFDLTNTNNKWSEKQDLTAKSYLIVIPSLEVGEKYTFGYKMDVPASLKYNLSAEAGYEVSYTNSASNTQNTVKSTIIELNTGKAAMIEQTVIATVGGETIKDGDTVRTGEIIKYTVTVRNDGNEDATGVNVIANIPEGTNYIEYNKNTSLPENPTIAAIPETLIENTDRKEVKYQNATIKAKSQKSFEYMVIVKSNQSKQTEFVLKTTDSTNKVKETKIKHNIENSDVKITVSKLDSIYNDSIKSGCNYRYKVTVENMSNKEMKDLSVAIDTNSIMKFNKAYYIDSNKNVKETESKNINIEKIVGNGKVEITVEVIPEQPTNEVKEAELFAVVSNGNNKSRSNKLIEKVDAIELNIRFTSTSSTKTEGYLHSGDEVKYTLELKNEGNNDASSLIIKDQISDYLELQNVTLNDKAAEYSRDEVYGDKVDYSIITIKAPLKKGESAKVVITAKVKEALKLQELVKVINKATLYNVIEIAKTDDIVYFIEKTINISDESKEAEGEGDNQEKETGSGDKENGQSGKDKDGNVDKNQGGDNTNKENNNSNGNDLKGNYTITGTAWKDANENGARDKEEELLSDISVKLLDIQNKKYLTDASGKEIVAKTNSEGLYNITNIPEGKYIAIFEYDTNKYMLTTYRADGVANDRNSDVILNTISMNGEQNVLATSDTLDLKNSIANIDIGLLDAKIFDLELQKFITKIVVTNNEGTSTYEYKDAKIAKADIAAKNLKDSQVVVEYTIKVKNSGEIAGYVKNVVDYKSAELSFSSTLNKDWYSMGDNLYNTSLSNTKLEPGETRELKLILTKTMTESNTGLIANTAEISEAYNTRGIADKDSIPGNNANKEDDMGQADLIIGVKTGAAISYIVITLSIIVVIGVAAYLVSKKVLSKEIKFE